MKLVYYRGPEDVLYSFFWVNEQNQRVSPAFTTEDEAKQWLIKSVTTTVEASAKEPSKEPMPEVALTDKYTEGFNAGKLFAELEYVEVKQEVLELIAEAKPNKLLDKIKELLK